LFDFQFCNFSAPDKTPGKGDSHLLRLEPLVDFSLRVQRVA
jgi:hypothetical protein